jgi:hypothetical protein
MKSQKDLAKIAINDKSDSVCVAAVNDISDQVLLAEVAKNSFKSEVGIIAIAKILDESLLADIAIHAKDKYNRKRAIERLTDQDVLDAISMNDEDNDVRKCATKKWNDNELKAKSDQKSKLLKSNELNLAETLKTPRVLSPEELSTINDHQSEGIKSKNINDTMTLIVSAITSAMDPISRDFIRIEFEHFNETVKGDKFSLSEGENFAMLSFVSKVLNKWQEHLDWQNEGYSIQVQNSELLLIHGICKDYNDDVYNKTIYLYKTDTGLSGWGDTDFQKLLKELKPAGVTLTG